MQNVIFDALQALIVKIDADQNVINPSWGTFDAVIRSHQNGPRPSGAYAMIEMLAERDEADYVCREWRDIATPAGIEPRAVEKATHSAAFLFEIEIFASNCLDRARMIIAALKNPAARVEFPFSVLEIGDAKMRPELVQQRFEGRAMFNLTIGARLQSETLIDLINSVSLTVEGRDAANQITTSETKTITRI